MTYIEQPQPDLVELFDRLAALGRVMQRGAQTSTTSQALSLNSMTNGTSKLDKSKE